MAEAGPLGRTQAIRILQIGRTQIDALIREIPKRAPTTPGLGGGAWSPRDRVGKGRFSQRLGASLSGPGDPFRHDESHVPSLADFVSRHGRH